MTDAERAEHYEYIRSHGCYDCGSTIPGHHTPACETAEPGAAMDLPTIPATQWWVACRGGGEVNGRRVPVSERPRSL